MSRQLRQTVARVADELTLNARDLRRERPTELTADESDARVAATLERLAETLRQALKDAAT